MNMNYIYIVLLYRLIDNFYFYILYFKQIFIKKIFLIYEFLLFFDKYSF